MGWARKVGTTAARYGVRYGPHAVAAWKIAGPRVEAAARSKIDEVGARRTAFDHADSVADGSVLRVVDRGRALFVVLSGDEPLASYPEVERPLAELVARADLDKRVTPAEHRQRQLRTRLRRDGNPDADPGGSQGGAPGLPR
jgi:hypothetical protein